MASSAEIHSAKLDYAADVASIKPLELYGIDSCGITWEKLIRKNLAINVLDCGVSSCDFENCLMNEIKSDCNC